MNAANKNLSSFAAAGPAQDENDSGLQRSLSDLRARHRKEGQRHVLF